MFNVGDLIIYSAHGICHIDDICEKTYNDVTKKYYVLHPLDNAKVSINIPVDSHTVVMLDMLDQDEAKVIMELFKSPGVSWIENNNLRKKTYTDIINTGDRREISKILNTLMRKKMETDLTKEKLLDQDIQQMYSIQQILFRDLSHSLHTSVESIRQQVSHSLKSSMQTT
ncbi:CarD family transcriptional regulator [Psychrobacillus sp. FJAT-51614]|uniref:CarD family transcriptional regulator n=1 Tax=Psychrobacillus mangrovi TaxID=3117745 RepID=A0ABU8F4P1_9BACI